MIFMSLVHNFKNFIRHLSSIFILGKNIIIRGGGELWTNIIFWEPPARAPVSSSSFDLAIFFLIRRSSQRRMFLLHSIKLDQDAAPHVLKNVLFVFVLNLRLYCCVMEKYNTSGQFRFILYLCLFLLCICVSYLLAKM